MTISASILWLIAAAFMFIIEILGGTVALLCLCIGCLASALCAALGLSVTVQVVVAAVVTLAVFFIAGPTIRRFYQGRHSKHHISNMDALIGREGLVIAPVTANHSDGGRVKIDGDNWQSYTTSPDAPLPVGSHVIVESYDSIVLHVRPADKTPG